MRWLVKLPYTSNEQNEIVCRMMDDVNKYFVNFKLKSEKAKEFCKVCWKSSKIFK